MNPADAQQAATDAYMLGMIIGGFVGWAAAWLFTRPRI